MNLSGRAFIVSLLFFIGIPCGFALEFGQINLHKVFLAHPKMKSYNQEFRAFTLSGGADIPTKDQIRIRQGLSKLDLKFVAKRDLVHEKSKTMISRLEMQIESLRQGDQSRLTDKLQSLVLKIKDQKRQKFDQLVALREKYLISKDKLFQGVFTTKAKSEQILSSIYAEIQRAVEVIRITRDLDFVLNVSKSAKINISDQDPFLSLLMNQIESDLPFDQNMSSHKLNLYVHMNSRKPRFNQFFRKSVNLTNEVISELLRGQR